MEHPAMCGEKSIHCRILRSRKYFYEGNISMQTEPFVQKSMRRNKESFLLGFLWILCLKWRR